VVFDHRERELNTWGVGAVGSVWEKGKSFTTVRSREGAGRVILEAFQSLAIGRSGMPEA
jgi:hypothetical protein